MGALAERLGGMVFARKHDDRGTVAPLTPIQDATYVVFDTELTGLKPKKDSIVSIGAVRMRGRSIAVGETFYRLVEPRTTLTGKSVVVHGITPTEAAAWPDIDRLLPEFLEFCKGAVLVGHVVSIDLAFLNSDMKRLYGQPLTHLAVDTFALYRWLSGRERNVCAYYDGSSEDSASLFQLAAYYGISPGEAHNALSDAYVTAQLFQRFLGRLEEQGVRTVRDLIRIGRP
jgi:DNA polymerase-3 subunit epsilon